MSEFVKTEHLSFSYEDEGDRQNPALEDVSIAVQDGEYVAILGHNGSGKSTFAKLLNMILSPDSGKICIAGREVTAPDFTEDDMFDVRREVGMVFQNPDNQLVATIVEEDVAFGPENLGLPRKELRERVDRALSMVGMIEYAQHAPHRLSGGQKQRIAIAGIIAMMPKCIIFDEATAMLDPLGRREVMSTMDMLNRDHHIAILNITHYMDEAAHADRIIVVNDGRVYMDGTPGEVFSRIDELHAIGLEAPQTTELFDFLRREGCPLPAGYTEDEACIDALVRLYEEA
ncbi:MAG: energy-coupling factor transporter ATPase [Clostridia bacterium]|nr:energy-coupling factor transporter ATPase [Clostridia bacterium]